MADAEKPVMARYRDRMDKTVHALKEEFGGLRTGRASASLLEQVRLPLWAMAGIVEARIKTISSLEVAL